MRPANLVRPLTLAGVGLMALARCGGGAPAQPSGVQCPAFTSTGCATGTGVTVLFVDRTVHSDTRCFSVYVNSFQCQHPASPICFGPNPTGSSGETIALGQFPDLGRADLVVWSQSTTPSRWCVWDNYPLSGCDVRTITIEAPCG